MERNAPRFDRQLMVSHTQLAKARVQETLKRARNIEADAQREARLERQFCKACHYFSRIAAQAFTTQPCACCGVPQTYSSSATDVLCMVCAQSHDLCKHCGGDLEMHTGRLNWPSAPPAPPSSENVAFEPTAIDRPSWLDGGEEAVAMAREDGLLGANAPVDEQAGG